MSDQYLILKGCAGLGNRLITLSHAINLANKSGRKLYVDWADGQFGVYGKNVFYDYFNLNEVACETSMPLINEQQTIYPAEYRKFINKGIYDVCIVVERKPFNKFPRVLCITENLKKLRNYWVFIDKKMPNPNDDRKTFLKKIFSSNSFLLGRDLPTKLKENVVIYADFYPPFSKDVFLKYISLKDEINKIINDYAFEHKLGNKTLGLHIRSTDKKPTTTFQKMLTKLDPYMKNGYQLFLASDNPEVFEALKTRYGNKVITYPKFIPQVKTEGIHQWALYNNKPEFAERILKESIIDMWLLSKCETLFYQGNSSFSFISKHLHADQTKVFDWMK